MKIKYIEEFAIKILMALSLLTVLGFVVGIIYTIFHQLHMSLIATHMILLDWHRRDCFS